MARPVSALELTPEEKLHLQRVAHSKTGSQRDGLRARIVLRRAEGAREADVAGALGVSLTTVSTWSRRFALQRSEERRVGKECRYRGSRGQEKKDEESQARG